MGPNSGGNPSKNPAGKSNPASKWDDLKLSALALLGHIDLGSVPPQYGEGFRNDPQREGTHEERIAIWNDDKVAAPILLGKLSFDDARRDLRRARSNAQLSATNALESGVPFNEHATLWDDLQVGAKILLGLIDYEDAKRDFLRRQAAAMRGTAEAQEGEYDPAKHPRGGDARYPGRYSAGWGSGAAPDPTSGKAHFQGAVQICFRAGTPVSNEHGAEAIEKVLAGQYVHCVPEDNPYSEVVLRKVLATHRNDAQPLLRVRAGALDLWTTFNHPFWVEGRGWTAAGKLQVGDLPRTREGKTLAVREIAETGIVEPVYNLTVEDCHTYFVGSPDGAGSVLVHNDSPQVAKADELEKGVTAGTIAAPVEVKAKIEKRWYTTDARQPPALHDAMVFEVGGKRVDPNDVELVQFIGRVASTDITYRKTRLSPNGGAGIESNYTRGTVKNPEFQLDNVATNTFTATHGHPFVKRENGRLDFFDSPSFPPVEDPQVAIVETFVLYKGKPIYRVHWEKTNANVTVKRIAAGVPALDAGRLGLGLNEAL